MKTFQVNAIGAAIILAFLFMGGLAVFVLLPIVFIQWTWNSVVPTISALPQINMWQSTLLYLAAATIFYLTGLVQIHIESN
jgi:hypothetical protein